MTVIVWQWIAAAFLVAILILTGAAAQLGKGDWAGWVQAVGTIAAVWATGWSVNKQHMQLRHKEHEDQQIECIRKLLVAMNLAVHGRELAKTAQRWLSPLNDTAYNLRTYPQDVVPSCRATALAMQRLDLPSNFFSYPTIEGAIAIESALIQLADTFDTARSGSASPRSDLYTTAIACINTCERGRKIFEEDHYDLTGNR